MDGIGHTISRCAYKLMDGGIGHRISRSTRKLAQTLELSKMVSEYEPRTKPTNKFT